MPLNKEPKPNQRSNGISKQNCDWKHKYNINNKQKYNIQDLEIYW